MTVLWLIKHEFYKFNLLTKAIRVAAKRYGQAEPDKSKKRASDIKL
jgi:hypothetical protein